MGFRGSASARNRFELFYGDTGQRIVVMNFLATSTFDRKDAERIEGCEERKIE